MVPVPTFFLRRHSLVGEEHQANDRKVAGSMPGIKHYVIVSLGKTLKLRLIS